MELTLYTDPAIFDDLAEEWQDLMGRAVTAPIFMTPDYQKIWWRHLGVGQLRVLVVREPNSRKLVGLAPLLMMNVFEALKEINREEGTAVLLVEQNARLALQFSQRGYVLETGHLVMEGVSADLLRNPDVQKAYLGG